MLSGAGLGLRQEFLQELIEATTRGDDLPIDFLEMAPENWMGLGGRPAKQLRSLTERYPFACHGLSLSIGGSAPLNLEFIHDLKHFLDHHQIETYNDHLCFTSDQGQLYDLLPVAFSEEMVHHITGRIRQVQEILQRQIGIENISYYHRFESPLSETEFIRAVTEEADCKLLLDVNNIYVNSVNHQFDPLPVLQAMPLERVQYIHIAGHEQCQIPRILDTHGTPVIDPVWKLLEATYQQAGALPTLLERDLNVPPLEALLDEVHKIHQLQQAEGGSA